MLYPLSYEGGIGFSDFAPLSSQLHPNKPPQTS